MWASHHFSGSEKRPKKKFEHAAFFNVVLNYVVFRVVKNDRVWAKTTLKTHACSEASYEMGALVLVKLPFIME